MKVADVMTRGVISLAPGDTVRHAAELMLRYDMSGLPVLDHGKLVGMITQGDFLRRTETGTERHRARWSEFFADPGRLAEDYVHSHALTVAETMTRDVITVDADASLDAAVELMEHHHVRRLPVMSNGVMVGIISRSNLLHAFLAGSTEDDSAPLSDDAIRARLMAELARQPWIPRGAVEATVAKGVVVLDGVIRDERQRTALRVAAESIPGVRSVVDKLRAIDLTVVS
jgi:CBS domain-containing protein